MRFKTVVALIILLASASFAFSQGNPTGAIRGAVIDPDGLAMPGVTVTAASPALQGTRTAVTSGNGDFMIPFLPPGEYTVIFELQGFQTQKQVIGVAMAETAPMKITLSVATVTETVTVKGSASTEVLTTGTVAETYKSQTLEQLPIGRTLNDAVLLAPGVNSNGPSGNIVMGGALSYENLFLVNGVNVNENLRGQARLLYIEDAIQETKVSTGSISAEYGRFQGGVVNMITKSGGNRFSGSFRDSFSNDAWRKLAPLNDQKVNKTVPVYEVTLGGPILKDRLWFFGAGRYSDQKRNQTLDQTNLNFTQGTLDERGEGKLTYALNNANKVVGSYTKKSQKNTNNTSNGPLDLASLYDNKNLDTLTVVNYSSVLTSSLFFEGQYSRKGMETIGTGAQYEDFVKGTMLIDRPTSGRYNSPTFCAVCGKGWDELRNNWDWFLKLGYFLSTKNAGSHNVVAGFDNFKETRKVDNYQSGSGYRVNVTRTIIDPGPDKTLYPVVDKNSYLNWTPLVAESIGSDIRTYSAFVNDAWRLSDRLSFNVGFRYDRNSSKDQGGVPVVKDWQWSPRLGVTWDMKRDGKWIANGGYARYVQGINGAVVDAGSRGGRTASYSWNYTGTATFNTACVPGATPCLTADQILPAIWNWFQSVGGTSNTNYRSAPSIPGVTTKVASGVRAPSTDEFAGGLAHEMGRGAVRVDYVYRTVQNMYGSYTDATTGFVTDPTGRTYDAEIVKNTPDARRWYHGITTNATYRFSNGQVGANYTLSWSKGNVAGENVGSGPVMAGINTFPEYRAQAWNWPDGFNGNDQRHKLRAFVSYGLPLSPALGQFTMGVVQRFDSGTPYDMNILVDSRPYVTGTPYLKAPATVGYYVTGRGALRWDNTWTTDLSLNWSKKLPGLRSTELFFRGVVTNLFNNLALQTGNVTVNSAASPGSAKNLVGFNPFTTVPVEGVHYAKDPGVVGPDGTIQKAFGQATQPRDYQFPRSANFSIGVRF
jgi:outer membrane receptor for ferrienterochelin and colicin